MEIRLLDNRGGYHDLVTTVRDVGRPVTVRNQPTRELTGVTLKYVDTYHPMLPVGVGRKVNTDLAAVEALQLIGGYDAHDLVVQASPDYGRVMVDPDDLEYGAYGPRIANQLPHVIHQLRMDPNTRQAVMMIWRPEDLAHRGDKPCTLDLQFLIRDNRLELYTTMRSQDVWLGVPYDVFMFTQLQLTVARLLNVESGVYVHRVTSLHIYERDVEASHRLAYPGKPTDLPYGIDHSGTAEGTVPMLARVRSLLRNELALNNDTVWLEQNKWYVGRIRALHDQAVAS